MTSEANFAPKVMPPVLNIRIIQNAIEKWLNRSRPKLSIKRSKDAKCIIITWTDLQKILTHFCGDLEGLYG